MTGCGRVVDPGVPRAELSAALRASGCPRARAVPPGKDPMPTPNRIHVMSESDVRRAVARMSREVVERNGVVDGEDHEAEARSEQQPP